MKYLILAICLGMAGCSGFAKEGALNKTEAKADGIREALLIDKCIEGVRQQTEAGSNDLIAFLQSGVLERRIAAINNVCFCTSEVAISYRRDAVDMVKLLKENRDIILSAIQGGVENFNPELVETLKSLSRKMDTLSANLASKEDALRAEQRRLLMREF